MQNPKFQIYTGQNSQFYFRLIARNGQNILASEGYTAKSGCENGIQSVKENAPLDDRYRRKEAKDGRFYFDLIAANAQVIGTSQMYKTQRGRDGGIEAVKRVAAEAPVDDTAA